MKPDARCDIIMKGGITSGVVYPSAVAELSDSFRFVNIGGSSAGAIAAALTAAAEFARSQGRQDGFERLRRLPAFFRETTDGETNLLKLFQPTTGSKHLFAILRAALNRQSGLARTAAALREAAFQRPQWAAIGTVPGIATCAAGLALFSAGSTAWLRAVAGLSTLIGLLLALFGAVAAASLACAFDGVSALPAQGFGICPGITPAGSKTPALTDWLADEIDLVARGAISPSPLTLGDLRREDIRLVVLTTNLTHGRPYTIPFDSRAFAYDPAELRRVFPERIVRWLDDHARQHREGDLQAALARQNLKLLPASDELPIIVAARLSLSFPLLLSAVPLWTFDFTRTFNAEKHPARPSARAERCWFSDGGIGSNFPVHFFDGPLPRWPTFAINLGPFHPDHPQQPREEDNVWRASSNGDGMSEAWSHFDDAQSRLGRLGGFLGAIIETMHNWRDNALLRVPGYRDRVVHVHLSDEEGGLNLNMRPEVLDRLEARGKAAGKLLTHAFGSSVPAGTALSAWDNHRWLRLRTTMNLLDELHEQIGTAIPYGLAPTYKDLLKVLGAKNPYPWPAGQQAAAVAAIDAFLALWPSTPQPPLRGSVPRPVPFLSVTPPTAMPPRR